MSISFAACKQLAMNDCKKHKGCTWGGPQIKCHTRGLVKGTVIGPRRKKVASAVGTRAPSAYNIFVKNFAAKHKGEFATGADLIRAAAKAWKSGQRGGVKPYAGGLPKGAFPSKEEMINDLEEVGIDTAGRNGNEIRNIWLKNTPMGKSFDR